MHYTRSFGMEFCSWLISYSAGGEYVRRGLAGEFLWWMNRLGVEPQWLMYAICCASCLAAVAWFVSTAVRRGFCWWPLATSFCLGGLYVCKTDFLVLLLVMAMVVAFARAGRGPARLLAVNALGVVAVNVHELSFFVTVPFMALLLWDEGEGTSLPARLRRVASLAPVAAAFAASALFRGSEALALRMAEGWFAAQRSGYWPLDEIASGTSYIAYTPGALWKMTVDALFLSSTLGVPNAVWLAAASVCALFAVSKGLFVLGKDDSGPALPSLLVFQALCLLPVAPFFVDCARLFAFWSLSSYWFYFWIDGGRISRALPFEVTSGRATGRGCRALAVMAMLFVGMCPVSFRLGDCFARSAAGYVARVFVQLPARTGGLTSGLRYAVLELR